MIIFDENLYKLKLFYQCKDRCDVWYNVSKSVIIDADLTEYVSDQMMNLIGKGDKNLINGLSEIGFTPALILPNTDRFKNIYLNRISIKIIKRFRKE